MKDMKRKVRPNMNEKREVPQKTQNNTACEPVLGHSDGDSKIIRYPIKKGLTGRKWCLKRTSGQGYVYILDNVENQIGVTVDGVTAYVKKSDLLKVLGV